MGRTLMAVAVLTLVALLGWLVGAGGGKDGPPSIRTARPDGTSQMRIAELERRLDSLEARLAESGRRERATSAPTSDPSGGSPSESAPVTPAEKKRAVLTPTAEERETFRQEWIERFRRARTTSARLAVLRDGGVQIGKHADLATQRAFYREILDTSDRASEEGTQAAFELGYLARNVREYAEADAFFEGVQGAVATDTLPYAWAEFQLAWNRKFDGDAPAAEMRFRRVLDHPAAAASTKAAARYAIANIMQERGEPESARAELERLVEDSKPHHADPSTGYYVGLARKLLETGGG